MSLKWVEVMMKRLGFQKSQAMFTRRLTLGALDTVGGVISWVNPEVNKDIYIVMLDILTTTKSTGVSTLDVGTDSDGTTSDDGIFDGIDTGTAVLDISMKNDTQAVTHIIKLSAGEYLVASKATGAMAGLVGEAIVGYVLAE